MQVSIKDAYAKTFIATTHERNIVTKFTFVVEPYGLEIVTIAETHKEARKKVWEGLTQEEQDNCEYIECVEVEEVKQ